jgi:hypothetical protein
MNEKKSEARKILDMFEEAGFTVTYFLHYETENYTENSIQISIKSAGLNALCEEEPARAGDIIALIEKNNYRLMSFKTGPGILGEYAGTIYFSMTPVDSAVRE